MAEITFCWMTLIVVLTKETGKHQYIDCHSWNLSANISSHNGSGYQVEVKILWASMPMLLPRNELWKIAEFFKDRYWAHGSLYLRQWLGWGDSVRACGYSVHLACLWLYYSSLVLLVMCGGLDWCFIYVFSVLVFPVFIKPWLKIRHSTSCNHSLRNIIPIIYSSMFQINGERWTRNYSLKLKLKQFHSNFWQNLFKIYIQ